jgi:hypothetical protein
MTGRFDEQRDSLALECPECGAQPGKRCRMLGKANYQARRPHPERATAAWRKWLEVPAR